MGKSITQRQPDGTVIYKADKHLDIPHLDILTLLLGEFMYPPPPRSPTQGRVDSSPSIDLHTELTTFLTLTYKTQNTPRPNQTASSTPMPTTPANTPPPQAPPNSPGN